VASPNFRHPLTLAKDLIALDDISDGRAILGVGAGGTGWDATMLGQTPWPADERAARFEEFVELTDRLLRATRVTAEGRYYSVDEARTVPGCRQRPRLPIAVAATGPRAMAVAVAHGDTWVTTGPRTGVTGAEAVRAVRDQIGRLDRVCADAGRDPGSIDRLVLTGVPLPSGLESPDAFADTAGHYAELGVTDLVVHWPRDDEPYAGNEAVFERIFA
jgi:alkanesulfonate monooxygenase SsuD/methylene tetrahydromethanopterin reductase-like flavin-dependent oxidoreductase (luciferase family)